MSAIWTAWAAASVALAGVGLAPGVIVVAACTALTYCLVAVAPGVRDSGKADYRPVPPTGPPESDSATPEDLLT